MVGWFDVILSGLVVGSAYVLVAHGYNLVYMATKTFNFAHAQFVAIGGLLTFSIVTRSAAVPLLLLAAAGVALLSAVEERLVVRPTTKDEGSEAWLVATLGASVLLQGLMIVIWGPDPHSVDMYGANRVLVFAGLRPTVGGLVLLAVAVAVSAGLIAVMRWTAVGHALVATAENPVAAALRGINTPRVVVICFVVAGALGAATGFFAAPVLLARSDLGAALLVKVFVVLALGGFGSNAGAAFGGWFLGVFESVARYQFGGSYVSIMMVALLLVVLIVRPQGVFGRRRLRDV